MCSQGNLIPEMPNDCHGFEPEYAAFVIPSSEGERTGIAPEDEAEYLAARDAINARLQDDKLFERIQREATPLPNDVVDL